MVTSNPTSKSWIPPFCPNPKCKRHNNSGDPWPFKKIGFFRRLTAPHRIQRFTCKTCKRSFSTQTFSTTYWQKRPDLDPQIIMKTTGGMANRQIARDLKVSPETINRHIARRGHLTVSSIHRRIWQKPLFYSARDRSFAEHAAYSHHLPF